MFKITASLSLIAGLRFFGLFVVMPLLSLYALNLGTDNMALVGIAISAYAISQIIFQIPFGILGDKYSKRHIIALGLVIFTIGSLICAFANSIEMLIFGRIVQGSGAIGSVVSAKITDLVNEEKRGSAMAFMGIMIFLSFIFAMIIGPSVGHKFGVDKLFLLTAILSVFAIILLYAIVPKSAHLRYDVDKDENLYPHIFKNQDLMILNISVFIQKLLLTFIFTIMPVILVKDLHLATQDIWKVFAISAVLGIFALAPGMIMAEKFKKPKAVVLIAIILFAIAYIYMGLGDFHRSQSTFVIGVVVFFAAFCMQEPILQNLASKYPKIQEKSLSLGIFTTFGYLGSFLGGIIAGNLFNKIAFIYISGFIVALMLLWFIVLLFLNNPSLQENLYKKLDFPPNLAKINAINGVIESYINTNENLLVVKYDKKYISKEDLEYNLEKTKQ